MNPAKKNFIFVDENGKQSLITEGFDDAINVKIFFY